MEYQKVKINAFAGLDVNLRPEMINDEQASELINLRFDKLGYLVNRNGVDLWALRADGGVSAGLNYGPGANTSRFMPIGCYGIGELVLDSPVADQANVAVPYNDGHMPNGTERLMVYALRIPPGDSSQGIDPTDNRNQNLGSTSNKYRGAYILRAETGTEGSRRTRWFLPNGERPISPSGSYTSTMMDPPEVNNTVGARSILAPSGLPAAWQIHAPVRNLRDTSDPATWDIDDNWIDHYVRMDRYRLFLVVADPNNGDLRIFDRKSLLAQGRATKHQIQLVENTIGEFDVNDVEVDLAVGEGQENHDVETGMAWYQFRLPRKTSIPTEDLYRPFYTAYTKRSPNLEFDKLDERMLAYPHGQNGPWVDYWSMRMPTGGAALTIDAIIAGELEGAAKAALTANEMPDTPQYTLCGIAYQHTKTYTFTTTAEPKEFDDLFGELGFDDPNNKSTSEIFAPDVYVWEDYKVKYNVCSGTKQGVRFLTSKDRSYKKRSSGSTKLIELEELKGKEEEVPLGIWGYKFVWEYEDGSYSAPCGELRVPDMLFSMLSDEEVIEANGEYHRGRAGGILSFLQDPIFAREHEFRYGEGPEVPLSERPVLNSTRSYVNNRLWFKDYSAGLTALGAKCIALKEQLYYPSHEYGAKHSLTGGDEWPSSWAGSSLRGMANVCVTATCFSSEDVVPLQGVFAEVALTRARGLEDDVEPDEYYEISWDEYRPKRVPLTVLLFPDYSRPMLCQSLFTDEGVCRMAYQNLERVLGPLYDPRIPSYRVILEGLNSLGHTDADNGWNHGNPFCEVATDGKHIYFQVVGRQHMYIGTTNSIHVPYDFNNNQSDINYLVPLRGYRNQTRIRGSRSQSSRLLNMRQGLPPEILSRAIVTGLAEFVLAEHGDSGCLFTEKSSKWPTIRTDDKAEILGLLEEANVAGQMHNLENRVRYERIRTMTSLYVMGFVLHVDNDVYRFVGFYDGVDRSQRWLKSNVVTLPLKNGNSDIVLDDVPVLDNLKVVVYLAGERLTIEEQVLSAFPASLLFGAPRLGLIIRSNKIPPRAKRLLIYRTAATYDNDWQPNRYGLVEAVEIDRGEDGTPNYPEGYFRYFDEVKDKDLDYSTPIEEYEGLTVPLRSRHVRAVNERVFYANYDETYVPTGLRTSSPGIDILGDEFPTGPGPVVASLPNHTIFEEESDSVRINPSTESLAYLFLRRDAGGVYSRVASSKIIGLGSPIGKKRVCFYCLSASPSAATESVDVFRLALPSGQSIPVTTASHGATVSVVPGRVYYVRDGAVEYLGRFYYQGHVFETVSTNDLGILSSEVYVPLAAYGDVVLWDLTDYLVPNSGENFRKIGEIVPEKEGVFYDNDLEAGVALRKRDIIPESILYRSGVRWSEPYQPNLIRLASVMEVRSGDGDQITGMTVNYGNLLVFKEQSMHRLAVQGAEVPVSRVDEVSGTIGCMAPNTVVTVDNQTYFLSWSGFYRYNNNVLERMDGSFAEELMVRLRHTVNGRRNPALRDASCAYNPTYNEIYLNVPVYTAGDSIRGSFVTGPGVTLSDSVGVRDIRGHVYAINLSTKQVTKYEYCDDWMFPAPPIDAPDIPGMSPMSGVYVDWEREPRTTAKVYYTTINGELRSAAVLPPRTGHPTGSIHGDGFGSNYWLPSGIYLESPTKRNWRGFESDSPFDEHVQYEQGADNIAVYDRIIPTLWRSKAWTAEDKSVIKRVRKVFAFMQSSSIRPTLIGITHTSPEGPTSLVETSWIYTYPPITRGAEIQAIPKESAGETSPSRTRGERYQFELRSAGRVQIENFAFYWRPINTYER